jgi:hypothetical protein
MHAESLIDPGAAKMLFEVVEQLNRNTLAAIGRHDEDIPRPSSHSDERLPNRSWHVLLVAGALFPQSKSS